MKNLKIWTASTFLLFCTSIVAGQNFRSQFNDLSQEDTLGQVKILKKWEASSPRDPELFVAWFNYYVRKSRTEVISLEKNQKGDQSLTLTDTSNGKTEGYLNENIIYEPINLQKGFNYIDRGIQLYPKRLDFRFGKIYILGESGNYRKFTNEIRAAIDYDEEIGGNWLWKDNKPLNDTPGFFEGSIQEYINTLFNSGESQLTMMREISETMLKYHPDHVESLSNIAVTFIMQGNLEMGLIYLQKAEKINPKDLVVLSNLAEVYNRKNDNANAIHYYKRIIDIGDPNSDEVKNAKINFDKLSK